MIIIPLFGMYPRKLNQYVEEMPQGQALCSTLHNSQEGNNLFNLLISGQVKYGIYAHWNTT